MLSHVNENESFTLITKSVITRLTISNRSPHNKEFFW